MTEIQEWWAALPTIGKIAVLYGVLGLSCIAWMWRASNHAPNLPWHD